MAEKKIKVEPEITDEQDPIVKLENRIYVLEAALAKHMGYHFGGIKPQ